MFLRQTSNEKKLDMGKPDIFFPFETHLKIINFVNRVFQCCLKRRVFIVFLLSAWLFNNGGVPKKMRGFTNINVLHKNNETMYTIEIFKIYFKNVQTKLYLISNKFSWFQMRE